MDLSNHEGEVQIPTTNTTTKDHYNNNNNSNNKKNSNIYDHNIIIKKGVVVKYRECLKNHAASIGGNATDGCGEFMPGGAQGTLEALTCSACTCHRNFHRRETQVDMNYTSPTHMMSMDMNMIMPLGAMHHDSDHELEGISNGGVMSARPLMVVKKRFRTKFTAEQKEKMLGFAESVGWKLQRQDDSVVQQFCQEIGIRRRVLKVWMHNNKQSLLKRSDATLQL